MGEYLMDGTQRLFGAEAGVGNSLNRYHFTRHLSVIQNGYKRGEYEQQSIHRRI